MRTLSGLIGRVGSSGDAATAGNAATGVGAAKSCRGLVELEVEGVASDGEESGAEDMWIVGAGERGLAGGHSWSGEDGGGGEVNVGCM